MVPTCSQNGASMLPKSINYLLKNNVSTNIGKGWSWPTELGSIFYRFLIHKKQSSTTVCEQNETTSKRSQNGATIDAQTHQQPMPKLVATKLMKQITTHGLLMCKNMQSYCKPNGFCKTSTLRARPEKVSQNHQK